MTTDGVADALIRIKNGYLATRGEVLLTYSKLNMAICQVLMDEGYVAKFEEVGDEKNQNFKQIKVGLKYEHKKPAISDIKRVSKPGLRVYKGKNALPYVLNGLGIALVSTPKGVMSDKKARKQGLGGEIMAYIW